MALAADTDLQAFGIDLFDYDNDLVDRLLNGASAAITEAAGSPIIRHTSTVRVIVHRGDSLRLPGYPVVSVDTIVRERDTWTVPQGGTTGWRLLSESVFLPGGWCPRREPESFAVTYTAGLLEAPADIVNLCVSLVAAVLLRTTERDSIEAAVGARDTSIASTSFQIDDYSESTSYQQGAGLTEQLTVFDLPDRTRRMLRKRFGGGGVSQWP